MAASPEIARRRSGLAGLLWLVGCVGCDHNPLDRLGLPWSTAPTEPAAKGAPVRLMGVDAVLQFNARGKNVLSLKIGDLQRRTPGVQPRVFDMFEQAEVVYEGVALEPTLDSVYGQDWLKAGAVSFAGLDGRKVAVPVSWIRKDKAWLVWRRMDRPGFNLSPAGGNGAFVDAAPLYLVWDTVGNPDLRDQGEINWVPGVASINLLDAPGGLDALTLPADASPAAVAGLALYKVHCAQCHAINGIGGGGGLELNVPQSVTEYLHPEALRQFIDNPAQVRARSAMPKLPSDIKDRPAAVGQLVAFLTEMAHRKVAVKQL